MAASAVAILEDVEPAVFVIRRCDGDFVKIAVASGIIVVHSQIEGRGLDQDRLRSIDSGLVVSAVNACQVDGNAVTAFAAEDHAQDGLSGRGGCLGNFGSNDLHEKLRHHR
jgi:hypothetical protein